MTVARIFCHISDSRDKYVGQSGYLAISTLDTSRCGQGGRPLQQCGTMGDVGLPKKHLGVDEVEVLHMRTHGKALVGPALVLLVTAVLIGIAVAASPPEWQPWANWTLFGLGGVVVIVWVLLPYLRWLTTTYTVTDRRIITRRGIINRSGHDLPLSRINNVTYDRSLLDRILGCGTLQLTTAAEAPVALHDVPDVERVHVMMTELLFGDDERDRRVPDAGE